MDAGREESQWKHTKWILSLLERCQSENAKGPLRPEYWDIPDRERKLNEHELKRQQEAADAKSAANDPQTLAAYKAARRAEFKRFKSQFRG